jgi:hypothetical protein
VEIAFVNDGTMIVTKFNKPKQVSLYVLKVTFLQAQKGLQVEKKLLSFYKNEPFYKDDVNIR